jgi:FlaA1/EpsC-like NDP-sugar epimerase
VKVPADEQKLRPSPKRFNRHRPALHSRQGFPSPDPLGWRGAAKTAIWNASVRFPGGLMIHSQKLTTRQWLIVLHDLLATAMALLATLVLRFEGPNLSARLEPTLIAAVTAFAGAVYFVFGLHGHKWRFTSLLEFARIVRAAAVLAISLLVLDYVLLSPNFYGAFFFGKITIALYFVIQTVLLSALRIAYRYWHEARSQRSTRLDDTASPALILGRAADVDVALRAIENGAIRKIWPVGVLSPAESDQRVTIRGVAVLGRFDDFENVLSLLREHKIGVLRLILTTSAFEPNAGVEGVLTKARRLGVVTSRLPTLEEAGAALRLAPVVVEDLLLRPTVKIDYGRLENFVKGKSIIVTGGGGSIGAEICDRVVTFGAKRLMVLENSEPALYAVLETLATKQVGTAIDGRIADIRDRERIMRLLKDFKPDIVFHAAALKHVPYLERDWAEGVKTNVFGSVNVADAAIAVGASLVMISTDKAIEPVSVLGATKRFAEMYCQALDADHGRPFQARPSSTRLISVRFGNVLASNGSVVPKFKAQIEAGGPVTVTHPDMVRYFMTIREACDLVVTAASHALSGDRTDVSVYVLNMGQPVKIVDLAERMIRLAGLEPQRDIEIVFTGIRPGERLNEILFAQDESNSEISVPGIVAAKPVSADLQTIKAWLTALERGLANDERSIIYEVLQAAVPDFRGEAA